ncbi:hypothetical protein [Paenibacillus periandrae]|uniref:hypothetical protein n=1 Tax=Paenibacillus periandrae TaxID=1761741 RepID=UPI001F088A7B|nr:hypothetical protein [Paenibacillus periandrae]
MEILLTFTEKQHAIEIEDTLQEFGYLCKIINTPVELLEVNVFYCKTSLIVTNGDHAIHRRVSILPVAGVFYKMNGRFESFLPEHKGA